MTQRKQEPQFLSVASLEPLLAFWKENLVPECSHMASMYKDLTQKIKNKPELRGDIKDLNILRENKDIVAPLMSTVFPWAGFHTEIAAAVTPYNNEPFYVTPLFQKLFMDENKSLKGRFKDDNLSSGDGRLIRVYLTILNNVYNITQAIDKPIIRIITDESTGLERHYSIQADFQFIDVKALKKPGKLSQADRAHIIDNITSIKVLKKYIDINNFQFTGFTVARATDVTESELISILEKDLVDQISIFSSDGMKRIEKRLQALFRRPEMMIGIGALEGDRVMIVKGDCNLNVDCIFANSHHLSLKELEGSIWHKAAEGNETIRIQDFKKIPNPTAVEQQAASSGIRSLMISPLAYQGSPIGVLELISTAPGEFNGMDELLIRQITPIFSVAVKRGLDELNKTVQSIIKEKCTAVHPSVEWRFHQVAMGHMERMRQGMASEVEPIIFKDVVPLFGQSDIRGSSLARNKGIQQDLIQQLSLAHNVMEAASKIRKWPLVDEYKYRIQQRIDQISTVINSGDEVSTFHFLQHEVAGAFDGFMNLGGDVVKEIENYRNALDPEAGIVYDKRKAYEESVSMLNETLSVYLAAEDSKIQETFPHYFEKRQTDGIDYMMYLGESMVESGKLAPFHVKNLTLWQMMLSCGLAWHTEKIKPKLKVALDICHLILINHTPLSIRFRYDEKRFDVDGAYDVRHEIIKSRLDKALVKGTGERLTQPGRIAVVYFNPDEGRQIQHHMDFLTARGKLDNDLEFLELDDLPDVSGLKALRVGINLEAMSNANIIEMRAG